MNTNWNDPNFQGFGGKNPFGGRPKKAKAPRKAIGTPLGRTAPRLIIEKINLLHHFIMR